VTSNFAARSRPRIESWLIAGWRVTGRVIAHRRPCALAIG
jgi:hypothetical protein